MILVNAPGPLRYDSRPRSGRRGLDPWDDDNFADTDYWSLLGLTPDADQEALKRAFDEKHAAGIPTSTAMTSEERFKLVNEAYANLSNPERKTEWIRLRQGRARCDPSAQDSPISRIISMWCLVRGAIEVQRWNRRSVDSDPRFEHGRPQLNLPHNPTDSIPR